MTDPKWTIYTACCGNLPQSRVTCILWLTPDESWVLLAPQACHSQWPLRMTGTWPPMYWGWRCGACVCHLGIQSLQGFQNQQRWDARTVEKQDSAYSSSMVLISHLLYWWLYYMHYKSNWASSDYHSPSKKGETERGTETDRQTNTQRQRHRQTYRQTEFVFKHAQIREHWISVFHFSPTSLLKHECMQ